VSGELDLYTAPRLRDAVIEAIDGGTTNVVLDIADVGFIDSTGLGALVGCLKRAREHSGSLVIVAPDTSPLHKLLTLTGLDDALPVHASVGDIPG
jgi:anti-sigma B factor antagonist